MEPDGALHAVQILLVPLPPALLLSLLLLFLKLIFFLKKSTIKD